MMYIRTVDIVSADEILSLVPVTEDDQRKQTVGSETEDQKTDSFFRMHAVNDPRI